MRLSEYQFAPPWSARPTALIALRYRQPVTALTVVMALHHRSVEPQTRHANIGVAHRQRLGRHVTERYRQPTTRPTGRFVLLADQRPLDAVDETAATASNRARSREMPPTEAGAPDARERRHAWARLLARVYEVADDLDRFSVVAARHSSTWWCEEESLGAGPWRLADLPLSILELHQAPPPGIPPTWVPRRAILRYCSPTDICDVSRPIPGSRRRSCSCSGYRAR